MTSSFSAAAPDVVHRMRETPGGNSSGGVASVHVSAQGRLVANVAPEGSVRRTAASAFVAEIGEGWDTDLWI